MKTNYNFIVILIHVATMTLEHNIWKRRTAQWICPWLLSFH